MRSRFFTINRKDRARPFLLLAIVGAINLVTFITLITTLIVFRADLANKTAYTAYSLHGIYVVINIALVLGCYFPVASKLHSTERNFFKSAIPLGLVGINFFTALNFYRKSGLSDSQKQRAIEMIKEQRIAEVVNQALATKRLKADVATKITTLLEIANNKHAERRVISAYILKTLRTNGIATALNISDKAIIARGKYL